MACPKNGIYIVQGEISLVVTAMRRTSRWISHGHHIHDDDADPLLSSFSRLKDVLNNVTELEELEPNAFLSPFLDVIRSEDTTGPITGFALTSVNKFLSYGLIDAHCETAAPAIENIADAVTHARFVGTDPGSDEVVLMKILHVLRTLILAPAGILLTNESVCEIMQSCFRICFEMRLSELLRKSAEHTLMDMVQLLFSRLPQFREDPKWSAIMKKLKMRTGGVDPSRMSRKKRSPKIKPKRSSTTMDAIPQQLGEENSQSVELGETTETADAVTAGTAYINMSSERIATTPVTPGDGVIDIVETFQNATNQETENASQTVLQNEHGAEINPAESPPDESERLAGVISEHKSQLHSHVLLSIPGSEDDLRRSSSDPDLVGESDKLNVPLELVEDESYSTADNSDTSAHDDYVNPQGVRFTPQQLAKEGLGPLIPYGLPCVRELFRFLISLTNPLDRHNTDVMIHMGLSLLTVALESGADHISQFNSLLYLVKDDMCKNLFMLMQSDRLSLFAASLRVCFLLFESSRSHLKFQLEMFLTRLGDIVVSESPRTTYEMREISLEYIVHLWRIPALITELYFNYDCDLFCSNLFEDLTKLLSKNAFPVSGLFTTHLLSLDALLTVVDSIEQHCHSRILATTKMAAEGKTEAKPGMAVPVVPEPECRSDSVSVGPPTTGYGMAQRLLRNRDNSPASDVQRSKIKDQQKRGPQIRPNRMRVKSQIPTSEELQALRLKKKLYQTGTEQFNMKPIKGIQFLQEQGLLSSTLDAEEVVTFLKENPKLDKKMIGEYVGSKKNAKVFETFVNSFNFVDTRIDEALRMYLEAFRLSGEAPVISYLLEHFSSHWHKSNGEPFANEDAAFTLAYAVIMLNVDQHNHNVKKQNTPMTVEEFKRNLAKTNNGQDHDEELLEEIYSAIKAEEIVMPAEHTGLVKENYLWKVLLRRGASKEGLFMHAPTGAFDHDLFSLIWGPTVAALSFVFDKSMDEAIIQKAISGFRKCAMISAHYGMSDVFDNLVISLCKFTTLLSASESPENIPIAFGCNSKAQRAAQTVFGLAHRHGDILREGWKNMLDCMLQLYRAKLLPKALTEVEDYVDPSGKISIIKEETNTSQKIESGVLGSFYSYFTSESTNTKGPTPEEQEAIKHAQACITDCHLEHLITESKFLREDSLQELVKALIFASQGPEAHSSMGSTFDEDAAVFFLEMLVKVVLQNRDRVAPIWQAIRDHFYNLIVNASETTMLVERSVVGLLRLAVRLLRREELAPSVLTAMRILLMMKPNVIHNIPCETAYGLHELLRTNAANIHTNQDWYTLFTLLEVVGAGANPPPVLQVCSGVDVAEVLYDAGAQSDSEVPSGSVHSDNGERGYTSDSELYESQAKCHKTSSEVEIRLEPSNGSWLFVNREDTATGRDHPVNQFTIDFSDDLDFCDRKALLKSSETLSFLVRDAAHITPLNFESCIHAIRAFVEASLNGGRQKCCSQQKSSKDQKPHRRFSRKKNHGRMTKSQSSPSHLHQMNHGFSDDEQEVDGTAELHSLSIQLLDLMHTLHTRAAKIFQSWAEEERNKEDVEGIDAGTTSLWVKCWCPLLQGIARLCCDTRRQVRSQALTYLQRALLVHDLQTLSATEWEACFNKVLFPLLTKLLENINPQDPSGMEETRMRASTLLCKVFLQHLSPLLSLSTFTALWLTILEFMDKYMHVDKSDLLTEAIPESLKNMLLVMDTAGIFQTGDGLESQLWKLTWHRIDAFLPNLRYELFKPYEPEPRPVVQSQTDGTQSMPAISQDQVSPLDNSNVIKDANDNAGTSGPSNDMKSVTLATPLPVLHPVHTI